MDYLVIKKDYDFLGFGPYYVVTGSDNDPILIHADKELCERFAKLLNEEQKKIPFIAYVLDSEYQKSGSVFLAGIIVYQVSSYNIEHVYEGIKEYVSKKDREVIFKEIK
jgi:hypothetical protein